MTDERAEVKVNVAGVFGNTGEEQCMRTEVQGQIMQIL